MCGPCCGATRPGRFRSRQRSTPCTATRPSRRSPTGRRSSKLYDLLLTHTPTPIVALNRAVAVAELTGPEGALIEVDALGLSQYHLFHATRGELLLRLRRPDEAAAAFEAALQLTTNPAEQALLRARLDALRS